mmetsp:Transcript_2354/g.6087  ORF Transcript_2354/g.6087 Transcript_2354/m.6087 type:complete len:382 (+) Transcript_2354:210-1355(+)
MSRYVGTSNSSSGATTLATVRLALLSALFTGVISRCTGRRSTVCPRTLTSLGTSRSANSCGVVMRVSTLPLLNCTFSCRGVRTSKPASAERDSMKGTATSTLFSTVSAAPSTIWVMSPTLTSGMRRNALSTASACALVVYTSFQRPSSSLMASEGAAPASGLAVSSMDRSSSTAPRTSMGASRPRPTAYTASSSEILVAKVLCSVRFLGRAPLALPLPLPLPLSLPLSMRRGAGGASTGPSGSASSMELTLSLTWWRAWAAQVCAWMKAEPVRRLPAGRLSGSLVCAGRYLGVSSALTRWSSFSCSFCCLSATGSSEAGLSTAMGEPTDILTSSSWELVSLGGAATTSSCAGAGGGVGSASSFSSLLTVLGWPAAPFTSSS